MKVRNRLFIAAPTLALIVAVLWVGFTVAANIGIDLSLPRWISR
jgi:hypothetical protein